MILTSSEHNTVYSSAGILDFQSKSVFMSIIFGQALESYTFLFINFW